mgnify:CR=1 FL=1
MQMPNMGNRRVTCQYALHCEKKMIDGPSHKKVREELCKMLNQNNIYMCGHKTTKFENMPQNHGTLVLMTWKVVRIFVMDT